MKEVKMKVPCPNVLSLPLPLPLEGHIEELGISLVHSVLSVLHSETQA